MADQKINLDAFRDDGWYWDTPRGQRQIREAAKANEAADEEFGRAIAALFDWTHPGPPEGTD